MDLAEVYSGVLEKLAKIDYGRVWPGFKLYPFALYDKNEAIIDGKRMRRPKEFFANTFIEYGGRKIFIWSVEGKGFDGDFDVLAANLVHEAFHCFQLDSNEKRFPSDLDLLAFPTTYEGINAKYNENVLLSEMVSNGSYSDLGKLISLRRERKKTIGDIINQEYDAETIEGGAEYAGTMALQQLSKAKYEERLRKYCALIKEVSPLQIDIRRISYYLGALLLLVYEKNGIDFHHFGEKTFYEIAESQTTPLPCVTADYDSIKKLVAEDLAKKKASIENFIGTAKELVKTDGLICGYDPMNMIRYKNYVLCSHFVFLTVAGKEVSLMKPTLLELSKGSNQAIMGYYTN
jgi:hypothetical protein